MSIRDFWYEEALSDCISELMQEGKACYPWSQDNFLEGVYQTEESKIFGLASLLKDRKFEQAGMMLAKFVIEYNREVAELKAEDFIEDAIESYVSDNERDPPDELDN